MTLTANEWDDLAILVDRQERAERRAGIRDRAKWIALAAKCQNNSDEIRNLKPVALVDMTPRESEDQASHDRTITDKECPVCDELLAITSKGFECVECGHVEDVAIITPTDIEQGARS